MRPPAVWQQGSRCHTTYYRLFTLIMEEPPAVLIENEPFRCKHGIYAVANQADRLALIGQMSGQRSSNNNGPFRMIAPIFLFITCLVKVQ